MTKAALDIVGRLQGALLARAYVIPPRAAAAVAHLAGPPVVTKVYDATADVEACFFFAHYAMHYTYRSRSIHQSA